MRLACRNTLFCVRECGGGDATLAAKIILAEAGTRLCAQNAIPLIAGTVGSHASAPRNVQEQKHGGLAIVKTGVVPKTLTLQRPWWPYTPLGGDIIIYANVDVKQRKTVRTTVPARAR